MTRPERKLKTLNDKIAAKKTRAKDGSLGKRAKRWKKAAEKYQALVVAS